MYMNVLCNVNCNSEHNTNNIAEKREKRPLLYHQCVDLMNYYIGFNNWILGVKTKKLELTGSTFTATCTGKGPTVCKLPPCYILYCKVMISKTPLVCLQVPKFSISTEGSAAHTSSDTSLSKGTKAGFALKMAYVKACSQVWLLTYSFFPRKQMMVYSLENCISSTELFCFLSFKLVMLLL